MQSLQEQPPVTRPWHTIASYNGFSETSAELNALRAQMTEVLGADYHLFTNKVAFLPGGSEGSSSAFDSEISSRVASPLPNANKTAHLAPTLMTTRRSARNAKPGTPVPSAKTIIKPSEMDGESVIHKNTWTPIEKKHMDELLDKLRDEPDDASKWTKIASHLASWRTAAQVSQRYTKLVSRAEAKQPSPELKLVDEMLSEFKGQLASISDSKKRPHPELISRVFACIKQLERARKILHLDLDVAVHWGCACIACGLNPIIGLKWHCLDCPLDESLQPELHQNEDENRNEKDPIGASKKKKRTDDDAVILEQLLPRYYCDACHLKHEPMTHRMGRFSVPDYLDTTPGIGLWPQRPDNHNPNEFAYLDPTRVSGIPAENSALQ